MELELRVCWLSIWSGIPNLRRNNHKNSGTATSISYADYLEDLLTTGLSYYGNAAYPHHDSRTDLTALCVVSEAQRYLDLREQLLIARLRRHTAWEDYLNGTVGEPALRQSHRLRGRTVESRFTIHHDGQAEVSNLMTAGCVLSTIGQSSLVPVSQVLASHALPAGKYHLHRQNSPRLDV